MGLIKSLKRLKLKKLQPGKILVAAAKKVGGPIGGIASAAERTVAAANKVIGQAKQEAKDLGLTPTQEAERVANQVASATEGYAGVGGPMAGNNVLLIGGAVVLLFLLMRK